MERKSRSRLAAPLLTGGALAAVFLAGAAVALAFTGVLEARRAPAELSAVSDPLPLAPGAGEARPREPGWGAGSLRDRWSEGGGWRGAPVPGPRRPGEFREGALLLSPGVMRSLELTPEQEEGIRALLAEHRERTRQLLEELRPRLEEEVDSAREGIRGLLTPQQQDRLDRRLREGRSPGRR